jgi:hypothetical protein
MNDMNGPLKEVALLVDERRRYEAWLAALDARKESTPPHVFERVQADYRSRMEAVTQRLASHRKAIEDERASVQSRLSLLDAEERMRRDERAELDLRAHVGELDGENATSAFGAVDDAMEQLAGERASLDQRVKDLDDLLEIKATPAASEPPAAEAATPFVPPAALSAAAPTPGPVATERPRTPGGSFDEMAFLDAVVRKDGEAAEGEPVAAVNAPHESLALAEEPDSESLLAGLKPAGKGADDAPLAANVPANTPIVLRSSGAIEQSKTLKCNECGAMNYPTEWYCERCGAELAAL